MDDQLLSTLLSKAKGIEAAPPLAMAPVRETLDKGVGLFKGLTGLGDQGPAGPTAVNLGAIIGSGIPPVKGIETLLRSLKIIPKVIPSPPATKLMEMLYTFNPGKPSAEALEAAVSGARATPRMGFPSQYLNIPKRLSSPSPMNQVGPKRFEEWKAALGQSKESAPVESVRSLDELSNVARAPIGRSTEKKPILQEGGLRRNYTGSRLKVSKFSEDDIRTIRKLGNIQAAMEKFPGTPRPTLNDIIKRSSFYWVKD